MAPHTSAAAVPNQPPAMATATPHRLMTVGTTRFLPTVMTRTSCTSRNVKTCPAAEIALRVTETPRSLKGVSIAIASLPNA
jgi:N-acetylglucosamine-6-phosphate deacetylase